MHSTARHKYNGSDVSDGTKLHESPGMKDDNDDDYNDDVTSDESSQDDAPTSLSLSSTYMQNSNTNRSESYATNSSFGSTPQKNQHRSNKSKGHGSTVFISSVIILIIAIFTCHSFGNILEEYRDIDNAKLEQDRIAKVKELDEMIDRSIKNIQNKFHNQRPDIWNDISSRMYDVVLYPNKPSIITLFGKETNTMNCLAQLLGQLSGVMLGSNDFLILTPEDLGHDLGETIHSLKLQIMQKKAVVFQDLLNVNAQAIKAFHNLCDRDNPLVAHAIYIIIVVVDGYKPPEKGLAFIEKQIKKRLSEKIDKDMLGPLITRITDGAIIPISSEPDTENCSLPFY